MNEGPAQSANADALLAVRCQLGERTAFDELIQRWAQPLRRYVLRVSGDADATDDLVQEIWVGVVQGIGRLRDATKLRSWLFGIAHRTLMDRLRVRYAMPLDAEFDIGEIAMQDFASDRDEAQAAVERGLGLLPILERDVLTLFYLQELSVAEIAAALLVPVGTVKSRLFRARRSLRDQLTEQEITP